MSTTGRATGFLRWVAFPVAAAGVITGLALLNRGPEWTVERASGSNTILVDDARVDLRDREALNRSLRGARHLRTDDSTIVALRLADRVFLEIDAGTLAGCPNAPGRFVDTDLNVSLAEGAIRIVTGPGFSGRRLRVWTPEARAEVHGTTFAVTRHGQGSDLSVYEGSLEVGTGSQGSVEVPAGRFAHISRPRAEASILPLPASEKDRLGRLRGEAFR